MFLRGVRTNLVLVAVIGQYTRVFQVILVLEGLWRAAEAGTGWKEPPLWWRSQDWRGPKESLGLGTMCQNQTLWRDVRYKLWNPSILEMPGLWNSHQDSSTCGVELARACEIKCACCRWGSWRSGAAPGRSRVNPRYSALSYKIWFMALKFALVLFKLYPIPPCWSMKICSLFCLVGLVLFLVLFSLIGAHSWDFGYVT